VILRRAFYVEFIRMGVLFRLKDYNSGQVWVETRGGVIQDAGVNREGNYR